MPGPTIARYRVLEKLGAGGMGEVYRAHDDQLGRDLAIKVLPPQDDRDPTAVERFFREARAASALNHPNIVTIYEAGRAEAQYFIAMELVRGRTLRTLIGQPLAVETLSGWGAQIARALAVAHAAGIVHRDIKPDNIMVRDDGYVKILDFGVARLRQPGGASGVHALADSTSHVIVGTLRYMSPEQASGSIVETATDVFSLGIVLYELATGRHPFDAETPYGLLHAILSHRPVPPARLAAELPRDTSGLILRMLEKDSWQRPTADEVAAALAAPPARTPAGQAVEPVAANRRTVGHQVERAELRRAFEQAAAGRGVMVCVAGEPGIGKSTLVEDFLAERQAAGMACRIAKGRCSERLAGAEAYLPILDALENLLRSQDGSAVARVLKTVAPLWQMQIAPLAADDASAHRLSAEIRAGSQERLKRELVAFVEEVARTQPLVLFIDDVHWVDVSTVDLISYLANQFDSIALLIVVTYRPEELLRHKHPFLRVKQDLQARGRCRELPLDFLTASDVEAYLRLEFPRHQFPPTFAGLIHAKTEGNPLFMVDVLRYLRDRDVLARHDDGWTLHETLPDIARSLPESVRSVIERKIDGMEETDRRLLLAASVQGYEFHGAVVARVLAMEPADVEERLERLDRVHAFVRPLHELEFPDGTLTLRYRFVHVLYQNLLYSALTPTRRMALSHAVARALESAYGERIAEIASELAVLDEAAREPARAADHFLTAAQRAARVFAYQEAILLAERGLEALQLLPETPERKRRELALLLTMGVPVIAAQGFGHPRVQEVYSRARALCLESNETSELFRVLWGLWTFNFVTLRLEPAAEVASHLLDLAQQTEDRALLVQAHQALGQNSFYYGDFSVALGHFELVLKLYDPQAHSAHTTSYGYDPCAVARAYAAWILWTKGYPDCAVREVDLAIQRARELAHARTLVTALFFAAVIHQFRHEWETARGYTEELMAVAADKGLPHFEAAARIFLGLALAQRGQREEGIHQMREGLAAYQATGAQASRPRVRAQLAEQLGRASRVEEALTIVGDEIESTGSARFHLAELYRVQGDLLQAEPAATSRAEACYRQAIEVARQQQAKAFELRAVMGLCRLWRDQGKEDRARQMLADTYFWFTEGLDTGDLREAKALLDALSNSGVST